MATKLTELLGIRYPVIAGGMVWCSGWRLAAAVSKAGGLGLIGAGSMHPETFREHIEKCKNELGDIPFGVNIPLFYPELEAVMAIIEECGVKIVVTSGGSPALYTSRLKAHGMVVMHVVASTKFALKAEAAGVDAVIAEGFEAGGHNGRDETTTMVLTPLVVGAVSVPVVAAGGIASGDQMAAALALGAEGVQVGSRFALCEESSAHSLFKERCYNLPEGDTMLTLKALSPVRLVKNEFYNEVEELLKRGGSKEEQIELLGKGRAKKGIFEGNLAEGEVEIGQVASMIASGESAEDVVNDLINGYRKCLKRVANLAL